MMIYPAIDLRHGKVVQLVGGDPHRVGAAPDRTPVEQAQHFRRDGAHRLHVVDLDAALGGPDQWVHLGRILAAGLPVQFGGGIRSMLQVQKLLEMGVGRVVLGTQGVRNPEWVRELAHLWPGRIVLAVDARGRDVVVEGWTESAGLDVVELVRNLDDAGLAAFLYTNVEREGRMEGIDAAVVQDLRDAARQTELVVSGGVSTLDDLDTLQGLDVDGVVLGMGLYTDTLRLSDLMERYEGVVA